MAGIPGPLNAAWAGQEDNFYPYEKAPVEYFHFSGGTAKRYSVEPGAIIGEGDRKRGVHAAPSKKTNVLFLEKIAPPSTS